MPKAPSKGHSVDPKNIDWRLASAKRENDLIVRKYLTPCMIPGQLFRILSFPAADAVMERTLILDTPGLPFEVTGIEQDPAIFRHLRKTARHFEAERPRAKFRLDHGPGSLNKFLKACPEAPSEEQQFDYIYPDYMGTWSREKREDMALIFQKNLLRRGGILTLTIMSARGYPKTIAELESFMEASFTGAFLAPDNLTDGMLLKSRGLAGLICDLAAKHHQKLEQQVVNFYNSPAHTGLRRHVNSEISLTFQRTV